MKKLRFTFCCVSIVLLSWLAPAQSSQTNSPSQTFAAGLARLMAIIQPGTNEPTHTFTTTLKVLKADGLSKELADGEVELAFQSPDHLRVATKYEGQRVVAGRDGEDLWMHEPG